MGRRCGKDGIVIVFGGQGILLDVEGTTSSISFVYDVLFAFARTHIADFLTTHSGDEVVRSAAAQIAAEAGLQDLSIDDPGSRLLVVQAAIDLMNCDKKTKPLKDLQGMIWRQGFASGELVAHVFVDVPPALECWANSGLDVRVYSSGSIEAQKLFFAHTCFGDLGGYFRGHYDTSSGPKREVASYRTIATAMQMEPRQILFVSDVGEELDAARQSGMATALARRPGNPDTTACLQHEQIESFSEIIC